MGKKPTRSQYTTAPGMETRNLTAALGIAAVVLALFYFWFVALDRRFIFLYEHLGATPFDAETSSRYWMAGLVAAGIVLLLYAAVNLLLRRFVRAYRLPEWRAVWLMAFLPASFFLYRILADVGDPPLPWALTLVVLFVLGAGGALALYAASELVRSPRRSLWAWLDSLALLPVLLMLPLVVDFAMRRENLALLWLESILVLCGLAWAAVMTYAYRRFKQPYPPASQVLLAGVVSAWLLLPVLHYFISRPDNIRYISSGSNFFADSLWLELVTLALAAGVAWLVGMWRASADVRRLLWVAAGTALFLIVLYWGTGRV